MKTIFLFIITSSLMLALVSGETGMSQADTRRPTLTIDDALSIAKLYVELII
jgi:hypothetical protein